MPLTTTVPRRATTRTAPPRWAVRAAHVTALLPLPSSLWRLLLALGFSAGYTEQGLVQLDLGGWGTVYVVALSVLTEGAALLTLGLVRPWGEVVPSWVPGVGGRTIPLRAALVPAVVGCVVVAVMWTPVLGWWTLPHPDLTDTGTLIVGLLYLPMVAWAPLLGIVTFAYHRRRSTVPAAGAQLPATVRCATRQGPVDRGGHSGSGHRPSGSCQEEAGK